MKDKQISRRKFIENSGIALSSIAVLPGNLDLFQFSASSKPLRVGVIGVGSRGKGLLSLLRDVKDAEVTAICDLRDDNIALAKKLVPPACKVYKDYKELINDKAINAVIIATPLYLHHPMAVAALQKGKHVYLEKAISYDIPQAIDLVKQVEKSGLVFQVGHQYRYFGLYKRIKEIIDKGWIGKVQHYECQYHRNSDWRFPVPAGMDERFVNWRMYKASSGGLMTELCGHPIDVVNWMVGAAPLRVTGIGGIDYWKDGRENFDNVRVVYEYPNGVKSSVSSILSNGYKGYGIRILGDKGSIIVEREDALIFSENVKKEIGTVDGVTGATKAAHYGEGEKVDYSDLDPLKKDPTYYALVDFFECIRTGKKPAADVYTARDVAIASHMANVAMETRQEQVWKPEYSV